MMSSIELKIRLLRLIFQDRNPKDSLSSLDSLGIDVLDIFGSNISGTIIKLDEASNEFEYLSRGSKKEIRRATYSSIGNDLFFSFDDYFRYKDNPFKEPSDYLQNLLVNRKGEIDVIRKSAIQPKSEGIKLSAEANLLYHYLTTYGQSNLDENEIKEECRYLANVKLKIEQVIQLDQTRSSDASIKVEKAPLYDYEDRENYIVNIEELERYQDQILASKKLKASPFFGRMDLYHDKSNTVMSYYIGRDTIMGDFGPLVYDWRSEIGGHFYLKNETQFSYKANNYDLDLRRSFIINDGLFKSVFNEYRRANREQNKKKTVSQQDLVAKNVTAKTEVFKQINKPTIFESKNSIEVQIPATQEIQVPISVPSVQEFQISQDSITDPFLLEVIRQKRNINRLTDIISTIQQQQNEIIRQPIQMNLVIQGCAGSGKTMVLLHRLSYILFKNREIKPEQICVVTPSNFLGAELLPLAKELKLDQIQITTLDDYLIARLKDFQFDQKVLNETALYSTFKSENDLNNKFISYLYSNEYINRLKNEYQLFINQYYTFWDSSKSSISKILQLLGITVKDLGPTDRSRFQYLFHVSTLVIGKYADSLRIIRKNLENSKPQNRKLKEYTSLIKTLYQRIEEVKLTSRIPDQDVMKSLKDEIDQSQINSFLGIFRSKMTDQSEEFTQARQTINILSNLSIEENSLVNKLVMFGTSLPSTPDFLIKNFIVMFMKRVHDKYEVPWNNNNYRYKAYTVLMTVGLFSGRPNKSLSLMCIDEGQKYPTTIYRVLKAYNPQAAFNIYGDKDQAIDQDQVFDSWADVIKTFTSSYYELKQNYRNTSNICKFTSENLMIPMVPIGLDGKDVHYIENEQALIEQVRQLNTTMNDRNVIIVKDGNEQKMIAEQLVRNGILHQVIQLDNDQIEFDKLLIMKIDQVRGLEFEKVISVDLRMSRHEKYVAYTRALNELYIYRYKED